MKVRISYVVEVGDRFRAALNRYYGQPGLADRETIRKHYKNNGDSCNADIEQEFSNVQDGAEIKNN